ncbi:MAG: hypothetical protein JXR83_01890 [Deltaproteobacteria bacterium]|nr:hypothetical protein [Deltaproteobacteria bacterium]
MRTAVRHARPANDDDNRPQRSWPAREPQYEQWYAIVNHPSEPFALWFRYTLLQRRDGSGEARLWAIATDPAHPELQVVATQRLDLGAVAFERERFGLALGDAGFLANGRATGQVPSPVGSIAWDLEFAPAQHTFRSIASPLLSRLLSKSQHRSPNSAVAASGSVQLGDRRIELVDAAMTQGHTFGSVMQRRWTWGSCPRFDGAPGCSFEGVATSRGSRILMSCELQLDGQRHAFNTLGDLVGHRLGHPARGTRARFGLGEWTFAARSPALQVSGRFHAAPPYRLVRYQDVDGSPLYNCHHSSGSLDLDVRAVDGRERHLACAGRVPLELVERTPPLGSDRDYLPAE